MDDAALIARLAALQPPGPELARRRAVGAVPLRLRAAAPGSAPSRRHAAFSPRFALALAALCLALAAAALFTPPGQALTSWVGERFGFGHPGEHPTLRQLRHFATRGSGGEGQPAYVLVRGPAPGIGHYEFITFRNKREPGKAWPAGGRCFEIDFPEARGLASSGCGLPSARHPVIFGGAGGNSQPGGEFTYVSGRASKEVTTVEVEQNGRPVAVDLTPIPADLIDRLQIRRPFSFYVAFPPYAYHGGTLEVTARDSNGAVIAHQRTILPDPTVFLRQNCENARRLAKEGKLKWKFVRLDCRGVGGG